MCRYEIRAIQLVLSVVVPPCGKKGGQIGFDVWPNAAGRHSADNLPAKNAPEIKYSFRDIMIGGHRWSTQSS